MMNILAPSMLSVDFGHMERDLKRTVDAGVDMIHVDIMDGQFVPNISFGPPVIKYVRKAVPDAILDVHMMVKNPSRYFERFVSLGAGIITIHAEATDNLRNDLLLIRDIGRDIGADVGLKNGVKVGVAISPDTSITEIEYVMDIVDMVLVMSVYPGFGGQKFIGNTIAKVERLRTLIARSGSKALIEVDGGVQEDTAPQLVKAGADVLVSGSYVFKASQPEAVIHWMKTL